MVEICGDAEVKKATFEAVRIGRDEPLEFLQVSYRKLWLLGAPCY